MKLLTNQGGSISPLFCFLLCQKGNRSCPPCWPDECGATAAKFSAGQNATHRHRTHGTSQCCLLLTNQRNATSPAFKAPARKQTNNMIGVEFPIVSEFSEGRCEEINQYVEHVHQVRYPIDLESMLGGFESLLSCKAFGCGGLLLVTGGRRKVRSRGNLSGCLHT